jgi:hypothetical protein
MAELINTNVFDANKKFVDLSSLDYFWDKAKGYIDGVDASMSEKVTANEDAIKAINAELENIQGGVGSVGTQINEAIAALKLAETYEAKGAAATAESNAKAHADGLVMVDGVAKFDAAGAAAEVDGKLTTHAADAVAHVTADERTAWNSAKTAIDAFLKDADMTEKAVDTLAELQTYMTTDGEAAAKVVERIAALEALDHDAYVAADETVLSTAKSYADGLVMADGVVKFDAKGAAAQALADAKADAEAKYQVKGDYEAAGTADAKIAALKLADTYEAKGEAAKAQAAAIAQAKLDAAEALKGYYTKTEVDNLLSTNSTGDRAYAKQYTDELFGSFQFAANSDIDALFA